MKTPLTAAALRQRSSRGHEAQRAWTENQINAQLVELQGWKLVDGAIERSFAFRDYFDTIAFVNALAWMIHGEDHHPDLIVSYNRVTVRWNTHSVGGLSDNDFICAAKTDAIFARKAD
jgi:4a-hydroxytetrahydrobiopterin dehydratase